MHAAIVDSLCSRQMKMKNYEVLGARNQKPVANFRVRQGKFRVNCHGDGVIVELKSLMTSTSTDPGQMRMDVKGMVDKN